MIAPLLVVEILQLNVPEMAKSGGSISMASMILTRLRLDDMSKPKAEILIEDQSHLSGLLGHSCVGK